MLRSIETIAKTRKMALVIPIISMMVLSLSAVPVSADKTRTFIAVINSGQEAPPNTSKAFGVAFMTFHKDTKMLCYAITYSGLEVGEIAAHFHGPAAAGVNNMVLFEISPNPSPVGEAKSGCVGQLTKENEKDLKKGLFYINIHSDDGMMGGFPTGEIRGQVLPIKGAK